VQQFEEQDYSRQFDAKLWRKLLRYCKPYKKTFAILMSAGLILAVSDAAFPLFTGYAIDTFVVDADLSNLLVFGILYGVLILINSICVTVFIKQAGKLETFISHDVRAHGFEKLMKLSFSYFDRTPVGWIMARMTSDTYKIGDIIAWSCLDITWSLTIIVFSFGFMLITDVRLTVLILLVVPFMVLASIYFQRKILRAHRESRKFNSKITGAYNEGIGGAKTTKTLIREAQNFREFKVLSKGMEKAGVRAGTITALYFPVILSLTSIGIAIALGEGGRSVINNMISLGTLSIFISYAGLLSEPISNIARILSEMKSAQAAAERTIALIETDLEIVDSKEIVKQYGDFMEPKSDYWEKIQGNIAFQNVSFQYKNGEKVLEDFNLEVQAGEKIALVGETGSGKSTIINLLCRFYEPTKGQICIDGRDYRERSQIWLQSNLGYVLQSPHLFSGTIKENIRYGKLDATDEEIEEAAKTVDAYAFISKMEKGFDSEVGESGSKLSTGEKQLISFARAIIAKPSIFVLDEATSSIDTQSEQAIQRAIFKILEGRTSFIVAHRLSTIRHCDRILVIDQGRMIESGSHQVLLQKKGHYYNLYMNQFRDEAVATHLLQKN